MMEPFVTAVAVIVICAAACVSIVCLAFAVEWVLSVLSRFGP